MTNEAQLFAEIYGKEADTSSDEFRVFCLALYVNSKKRNKGAEPKHLNYLKEKYSRILPVMAQIQEHARKLHKEQMGRARGLL